MFSFITRPIGCLFSLIGSLVVITLVLALVLIGLIAYFMPQMSEKVISEATGFPTRIGDASLSLWHQRLELRDVHIDNPENYPEDDFLFIPRLSLSLDRKASSREHLVLSEVVLHIDTLTVVRLSATTLNSSEIVRNLLKNITLVPSGEAAYRPSLAPVYEPISEQPWQQNLPPNSSLIYFEPIRPPAATELPALLPPPVTYAADGTPSQGEHPRWLIRRLTIQIDSVRLFESSPQGNFLQLVPLQYQQTFDNVTSLGQVLPLLLQKLRQLHPM